MIINENLGITSPLGFLASGIHCGLKKSLLKKDLALIFSEVPAVSAAVYTKNKVKGAPLYITKQHLSNKKAQAIVINSGNANTCTGDDGLAKAKKTSSLVANALKIRANDVLVGSTGVIGVPLNIDAIKYGIPLLTEKLSKDGYNDACEAILTTDTVQKQCSIEIDVNGKKVTIGAMAKGSGMIHPNMATMLSFITTDLNISPSLLQDALKESVNISYNRISVDGDSSTNDMVVAMANGLAHNTEITSKNEDYYKFLQALNLINIYLSKKIAKDGEGATKLIECTVKGAPSVANAETFSRSIINSSLVKTAIFGSDANWGRVLCALGYANVNFNPKKVDVFFSSKAGSIMVCENGASVYFDEVKAKEILMLDEVSIEVNLKIGQSQVTTWGCDLTYDYVKINGDYRS